MDVRFIHLAQLNKLFVNVVSLPEVYPHIREFSAKTHKFGRRQAVNFQFVRRTVEYEGEVYYRVPRDRKGEFRLSFADCLPSP